MTDCTLPTDRLLEADLAELRGEGDGELARHLAACPRCAAQAREIVRATQAMDDLLHGVRPRPDIDAVIARARMGVEEGARAPEPGSSWPQRSWVGLALAAGIAALVLWSERPPELPGTPLAALPGPESAPPVLDGSQAGGAVVIETDNPDITVLWFFQGGGD